MDSKLTNEEMMAYLYGELSVEEKKAFEEKLRANPEVASELKELEQLRKIVGRVQDKEVVDPFFYWGKNTGTTWQTARIFGNSILKPAIGLAASFSLLILISYFTHLNISNRDGYLSINFGKPVVENISNQNEFVSKAQVEDILNRLIQEDQIQFTGRMEEVEQRINTKFASYTQQKHIEIRSAIDNNTELSNQLVTEFISQMQKENLKYMERYFEITNVTQQQYVQSLLTEFSDYLDSQREEDLLQIQLSLSNLKENQDIQKLETNQVLASIINTVNNQNNN